MTAFIHTSSSKGVLICHFVRPNVRQVILLGRPDQCDWVRRLCEREKIELTPASPGMNGFVLQFLEEGGRQIMLVGGGDALGVVYGADALFDLMRRSGEAVQVRVASVRD